jgi:hypothetical protein
MIIYRVEKSTSVVVFVTPHAVIFIIISPSSHAPVPSDCRCMLFHSAGSAGSDDSSFRIIHSFASIGTQKITIVEYIRIEFTALQAVVLVLIKIEPLFHSCRI